MKLYFLIKINQNFKIMKPLIIILIGLFINIVVDAQWHYNGMDLNELTKPQLELAKEHAEDLVSTGKVLTGIGVGAVAVGIILANSSYPKPSEIHKVYGDANRAAAGILLAYSGGAVVGGGISLWVIGNSRKKDVEVALIKYKSNDISMINPGVKLTFNF